MYMQVSIFRENMSILTNQALLQRCGMWFVRIGIKTFLKMVQMYRNMSEKVT